MTSSKNTGRRQRRQPSRHTKLRISSSLKEISGSNYAEFSTVLYAQVQNCLALGNGLPEKDKEIYRLGILGAMLGIAPGDEIEGMLAAQMVAAHQTAMECFRRAMAEGQTFDGRALNLSFANKLSRTFTMQMEALKGYRGKGEQTVRVEHVTVNAGGQAIVGNVAPAGGEEGQQKKTEEQPHAKQIGYEAPSYAPVPALPRSDPKRAALPVSSDVQRTLPDARRIVHGSTRGK